jgi:phosphocarrier protein
VIEGGPVPTTTVTLVNKLGMHARAAAAFVKIASAYDCEINVAMNGRQVSGKGIMGMMMLAAPKGSLLEISASGTDAPAALAALEKLVADRFGEDE